MRVSVCLVVVPLLAATLLAPAPAAADGTQTGTLTGTVVDAEGGALPGAQVTVAGPQGQRSGLTDADGRFRFPALTLGTYRVSAELLGLTASQSDVPVYSNRTTDLRLELGESGAAAPLPVLENAIQVVALAPVIDRYETRIGGQVSRDFLDQLPVERFYQSVALLLPGIAGGQDGNPNASGALRSENLFLIDGVDTTDPTTGLFGLNLAFEAIQTVDVTTAAAPVEYGRASGAVINVVTRSGGNDYDGLVRWVATDPDWNSSFAYPPELVAHLAPELAAAEVGTDTLNQTLAASLGGPLLRDRLWFYAAFEDTESSFLRPTRRAGLWDQDTALEAQAYKLTSQLTQGNTLVLQFTADAADFLAFTPFERGPTENRLGPAPGPLGSSFVDRLPGDLFALEQRSQEGDFAKLQWNSAIGQDLSVEVTLARQERRLTREPSNSRGLTADAPHVGVTRFRPVGDDFAIEEFVLFNGITDQGFEERPRDQGNLAVGWFTQTGAVDHEIKVGLDYQRTESERQFNFPGLAGIDGATGIPAQGQLFVDLDLTADCLLRNRCTPFDPATGAFEPFALLVFWRQPLRRTTEETTAVYLGDTLSTRRWLVSVGARFERIEGEDDRGRPLVSDEGIAPRVSVTYDPRGDGTVLLSASYSRLFEPFLQQYLDSFARLDIFSGFTEYGWARGAEECRGEDPGDLGSPCWIPLAFTPFFDVQAARPFTDLARSAVDEVVLGFERQLTPRTGLSLHYVEREWRDLWDNILGVVFTPDGRAIIDSGVRNLPFAERGYRAVQLLVQKRYADRWQLLGSYTWSEAEGNLFQNDGLSDFADFGRVTDINLINRFGLAPYDRRNQLKLFANYQVPLGRATLSLGSALRYESGVPFQAEQTLAFGRRFLTRRGSERLPDVFQLDLSLNAAVRLLEDLELEVKGEVFNLTDENQQLGVETEVTTGLFGLPRSLADLQAPRSFRLTLGLRF